MALLDINGLTDTKQAKMLRNKQVLVKRYLNKYCSPITGKLYKNEYECAKQENVHK